MRAQAPRLLIDDLRPIDAAEPTIAMFEFLTSLFKAPSKHQEDMATAMDLSELPTEALLKEMQRRLDCLNKPERRLVLIGTYLNPLHVRMWTDLAAISLV